MSNNVPALNVLADHPPSSRRKSARRDDGGAAFRFLTYCCRGLLWLGCLGWASTVVGQAPSDGADACRLAMPPAVYAVAGTEVNLYFQNVILAAPGRVWIMDVACTKGRQQVERWTWVPKEEDVGQIPLSIEVRDENDNVAARGQTTVHVSGAQSGAGRPLRLLCIGDSLTHHSVYTGELLKLCAGPDQPALKLLGTHRPYPNLAAGNVHEGYGGWRYADFVEKFTEHPEPGSYKKRSSPFVYPSPQGPVLDVARYVGESCEGNPPDAVTILLGANDVWGLKDATRVAELEKIVGYAKRLMAALRAGMPQTRIGILPLLPSAGQDAFGTDSYWDYRKSQHGLVEELLRDYRGREADGFFIIPAYAMIDTEHGYPRGAPEPVNARSTVTISRQNNAVHPNTSGHNQVADAIFGWLKYVGASE